MVYCETVIAYGTTVNNETELLATLAASAPLTTRVGRGRPKITHFMALASTNDISNVYLVPQGCNDANGIPCHSVNVYGATSGFNLESAKLEVPVEVPENCLLSIYATSETAANTVCFAWVVLEYPSTGKFEPIVAGVPVRRAWETGGALTSVVEQAGTTITSLLPGKMYQLAAIPSAGVNGYTAGNIGPVFIKINNVEMDGAAYWIPVSNGGSFLAAGVGTKVSNLAAAGMKMPKIQGGTPLITSVIGYTAEQPQAELTFRTDSIFK